MWNVRLDFSRIAPGKLNGSRVSLQELDLVCIIFWIDYFVLSYWDSGVVVGKAR